MVDVDSICLNYYIPVHEFAKMGLVMIFRADRRLWFSQIKNDGTLDKYIKKKIAAKGYDQKSDIGYEDTYI